MQMLHKNGTRERQSNWNVESLRNTETKTAHAEPAWTTQVVNADCMERKKKEKKSNLILNYQLFLYFPSPAGISR